MLSPTNQIDRVERDTGLTEHQQRERAAIAAVWSWRIHWLLLETGCRAVDALRAVELADREHMLTEKERSA
jgi:hypothetical protein